MPILDLDIDVLLRYYGKPDKSTQASVGYYAWLR